MQLEEGLVPTGSNTSTRVVAGLALRLSAVLVDLLLVGDGDVSIGVGVVNVRVFL